MIFVVMIVLETSLFVILSKWRLGLSCSFWGKVTGVSSIV